MFESGPEVGVRAVYALFETPESLATRRARPCGGIGGVPGVSDYFGFYLEGATSTLRDENPKNGRIRPDRGTALYARANVFAGPVTVLLEGKRYRKFSSLPETGPSIGKHRCSFAPTIERFDQQVFNTDTSGARVKVDYGIRSTKTRFHFNTMMNVYAPSFGEDPWDPNSRHNSTSTVGLTRSSAVRSAHLFGRLARGAGAWEG